MEEPKLADYGINKRDYDVIEERNDKIQFRLFIYATLLSVGGSLIIALNKKSIDLFLVILYFIGGIMFAAFICSPILIGIYNLYSKLFNEEYRKVKSYKKAKAEYEAWWIRSQIEFWSSLSGRRFEQELAHLYSKKNYKVSLTPPTDDRGIDIMLHKDNKNIIVQCKAHKKKVGPAIARELYGTLISSGADEAYLASVSGFSKGTIDFIKDKPIKLISLEEIINLQKSTTN